MTFSGRGLWLDALTRFIEHIGRIAFYRVLSQITLLTNDRTIINKRMKGYS